MKRFILTALPLVLTAGCNNKNSMEELATTAVSENRPADNFDQFAPENFSNKIDNPYFSLIPGRKYSFDGRNEEGIVVHKELVASDVTKEIMGVKTHTMWEREWKDNELIKDTKKWYAQDKQGNVWLFGEDEQNIFGGFSKSPGTSWLAGSNGATPGIIMPSSPQAGDRIAREYNGFNKQNSEVIAVNQPLSTRAGQYKDCLQIRNESTAEYSQIENSYYCRGAANLAQETLVDTFGKIDLTRVEDHFSTSGINISYPSLKVAVPEDRARENAMKSVEGATSVESIDLVLRNDTPTYRVRVAKEEGKAEEVFINIHNGSIVR